MFLTPIKHDSFWARSLSALLHTSNFYIRDLTQQVHTIKQLCKLFKGGSVGVRRMAERRSESAPVGIP